MNHIAWFREADPKSKTLGLQPECDAASDKTYMKLLSNLARCPLTRVVNRLVNKDGMARPTADQARIEFLRFLSQMHFTNDPITPSALADEFWHAFILHTRDYAQFCAAHFGHFVHHEPKDTLSPPRTLRYVLDVWQDHFGL